MYRSFTNRILGGVCGGLGDVLPLNPWWFRVLFVLLSVLTLGAFALLYLTLWMLIPQRTLLTRQRGGAGLLLLTLILTLATFLGWVASTSGGLRGPSGEPLYWPGLFLVVAGVFFLRQLRG
ncbi:MAG: PspC domain-containing protein [Anaerolineae bacterium]|jgi:phage shock protein PspC (stress-responsive transcriptional regulator)|nr:PspC domain-containing protein [Anaerolineae bacterium]